MIIPLFTQKRTECIVIFLSISYKILAHMSVICILFFLISRFFSGFDFLGSIVYLYLENTEGYRPIF
ncbi:MAG: hypothetical protein DBY42_06610 [Bacillota bacterium]|nr:MAG: hypothetical protein DBY42_06610 [Bacillota bacterium]